jgi:hypothetical protein
MGPDPAFKEEIMKVVSSIVTALAVAACVYSTASRAESGTPSRQEVGAAASAEIVSNDDGQVNDYARYLMVVDGKRRTDAIVEARNYPASDCVKVAAPRDIGSYARYLMVVDGQRYEEAMAEAANQDRRRVDRILVAR